MHNWHWKLAWKTNLAILPLIWIKALGRRIPNFVSLPNSKEWSKEELWLDLTTLFKFYANMCTAVNVQHVVCKMLVNKTTSY